MRELKKFERVLYWMLYFKVMRSYARAIASKENEAKGTIKGIINWAK